MDSSHSSSLVDFGCVLTESYRILTAHSRHFLALSVLFLLPLSFALSVLPTLLHTFPSPTPNHIQSLLKNKITLHPSLPFHTHFLFSLFFSSFTLFFSLLAVSSITNSVHNAFYGRPVRLISSFSSVLRSFLPLLLTCLTAISVLLVPFLFLVGFLPRFLPSLNFLVLPLLALISLYLFVQWILAGVIVVVERKWGVGPLTRSKELVGGMTWVSAALMGGFGGLETGVVGISWGVGGGTARGWLVGGKIVLTCAVLTMLLLHGMAAVTVLYMYCKALHGELAGEIAQEFAEDFVSLPFDDHKVPHVVCLVE